MKRQHSVYVAGSSREIERAERCAVLLSGSGVRVTSTWMANVRKVGDGNPRCAAPHDRLRWANGCLTDIHAADAVVILVPPAETGSIGAWVETGYAHALAKAMVFSGDTKQSVFCALGIEVASDELIVGAVLGILERRSR